MRNRREKLKFFEKINILAKIVEIELQLQYCLPWQHSRRREKFEKIEIYAFDH